MSLLKNAHSAQEHALLYAFTNGIRVDAELAQDEVQVQKAWAETLAEGNYLSAAELAEALAGLDEALRLMLNQKFPWREEDEDIHMNLERYLTETRGDIGKRIHQGRSRNDLIATTLRVYTQRLMREQSLRVRTVLQSLLTQAEKTLDIFIPGLTHVQHGQPIRLAHFFLAHAQTFQRDLSRLALVQERCRESLPLGSGALAGTPLNISLENLAQKLNFKTVTANSYDSVGDRDFILEALQAYSLCALHLSRLSEDFIYYSSTAIGLLKLSKDWSTGSSLMPNKRNPDVPELTRAKSAKVMGAANEALLLTKALPMSYNSDLHELKSILQRAHAELQSCLVVVAPFTVELSVDPQVAAAMCAKGEILATDLADKFVAEGLTFREAYKKVAALIESGNTKHFSAAELEASIEKRKSPGGSSRQRVVQELAKLKALYP